MIAGAILFFAVGALAADRGDELAVATNSELLGTGLASEPSCQRDGPTCLDCRTVGYCRGGILTRVSCRGLFPYCDQTTGTCSADRNRCKIPDSKTMIDCPVQGYFPDPETCRGFYVCEGSPLKSYKFQCTQLQVYDPEEKKCTRPSLRTRCLGFSCLGKHGRYTPYAGDESIYAMCKDGKASDPLKCPEGETFEEAVQKCQKKCSSEKNLPDLDDKSCKRYIRCTRNGNRFVSSPGTCLGQRLFNPTVGRCVEPAEYTCPRVQTTSPSSPVTIPASTQSSVISTSASSIVNPSTTTTTSRIGLATRPFDSSFLLRDSGSASTHKESDKAHVNPNENSLKTTEINVNPQIHTIGNEKPFSKPEATSGKTEIKINEAETPLLQITKETSDKTPTSQKPEPNEHSTKPNVPEKHNLNTVIKIEDNEDKKEHNVKSSSQSEKY